MLFGSLGNNAIGGGLSAKRQCAGCRLGLTAIAHALPQPLTVVIALAWSLRLVAVLRLSAHDDEAASILAARMVAAHGMPVLPSGVLYLQGTTLSYILAPLVGFGFSTVEGLTELRVVLAFLGTLAVVALFRLVTDVTGNRSVGLLAAVFLAIDPLSVEWGAHVRMYAPLQLCVVLLLWSGLALMRPHPIRRHMLWFVLIAWAAVFTHMAATLILAVVLIALLIGHRRSVLRRFALMATLVTAALAPVALVGLNRLAQLGDHTAVASKRVSFTGAQLIQPDRLFRPDVRSWTQLFDDGSVGRWAMMLVLVTSVYLFVRCALPGEHIQQRSSVGVLLAAYWLATVVTATITESVVVRYLMPLQPLSYALVAVALCDGWRLCRPPTRLTHLPKLAAPIVLSGLITVLSLVGLDHLFYHPVVRADYLTAYAFVGANRSPGETIIVSLPPLAEFGLGDASGLIFLAGQEGTDRVDRYVIERPDGRPMDYWLGIDVISSTEQLCRTLEAHPNAWIVVDETRLVSPRTYGGGMERVILGMTYGLYRAPGGALVRRVAPLADQIPSARQTCTDDVGAQLITVEPNAAMRYAA
jgi:hypothetical protein